MKTYNKEDNYLLAKKEVKNTSQEQTTFEKTWRINQKICCYPMHTHIIQ